MWPWRSRIEYYKIDSPMYPKVMYRYNLSTKLWSYWGHHRQKWQWETYKKLDFDAKETQNLRSSFSKSSKLEVLLVCGPEAVCE